MLRSRNIYVSVCAVPDRIITQQYSFLYKTAWRIWMKVIRAKKPMKAYAAPRLGQKPHRLSGVARAGHVAAIVANVHEVKGLSSSVWKVLV